MRGARDFFFESSMLREASQGCQIHSLSAAEHPTGIMRQTRLHPIAADTRLERDGARLRWRDDGVGRPWLLLHGWALDLE
ncbi:MAG: hypothetical protein EOP08_12415, partial [Proteobacteria bacterium]